MCTINKCDPIHTFANYTAQQDLPYPGRSAVFECRGEWTQKLEQGDIVRSLVFCTQTPGAFFTQVRVLGSDSGFVVLDANFSAGDKTKAKAYFVDQKLFETSDTEFDCDTISAETIEKRLRLFTVLIANNTFPQDNLGLFRQLISLEDWRTFTN